MSGSQRHPAVSVIIPTYNWSAALRCAIRSVLLQTVSDFEILIVGDGCTDDSEQVVAEFHDKRIRWHNLERNYGSQWAANNYAIEHAKSDWIAYLGHDDIWYPTHLEAILRAAKTCSAEVVTSVMALYGPPGSHFRAIAGLFASGTYSSRDFVPPSAFAHAKALYGDTIKWCDPATVALPMDAHFMSQTAAAARNFASTSELTSFKFNAAWRRDAYKVKNVDEQLAMLDRIESKVDFRQAELLDLLQSAISGRFWNVQMPTTQGIEPGWFVRQNRKFKGIDSRFQKTDLRKITRRRRFDVTGPTMPFEWHEVEQTRAHGTFRWSGPSQESTIDLPVIFNSDLLIRLKLLNCLVPAETIAVEIHGQRLTTVIRRGRNSSVTLEAEARMTEASASLNRDFGVTIKLTKTVRPCDVIETSRDSRWLGVALNWIELEPLSDFVTPPLSSETSAIDKTETVLHLHGMKPILQLLFFVVGVVGIGWLIGTTNLPGAWYAALTKPTFVPPNWAFPVAWTILYVMIGVSGWRTFSGSKRSAPRAIWILQLALNLLWSPVMFTMHQIGAAFAILTALLLTILIYIALELRRDWVAAALFVPYAGWVAFAGLLNAAIWRLN